MPTDFTTLTVGLPVYNDPEGLRRSVPTVAAQTWNGPVRLLIVDDGSTDETPAVVEELASAYHGIEVVTNDRNRGRPYTRNRILDLAGDGWLAWLDADDLWHPRKLELQFAALEHAGIGLDDDVLCTTPFRWCWIDTHQERLRVPTVEGDQVHSVMTGDLYPYLWTMLGPARAFRDAGGFDARLPRRQDYEFLLRFTAGGGRVISTPERQPLCTYVKSDTGRSPRDVARANRVIGSKHRETYRRYGRRFERECRRNRHRLVARFYDNNGQHRLAGLYRARARASEPIEWLVRRRLASRLVALLRAMRGYDRSRGTGTSAATRTTSRDAATAVLRAARDALESRDWQGAADVLGPFEATADDTAPVEVWYLLDDALRRIEEEDAALAATQRGSSRHPNDVELRSRLVELHSLCEHYGEAVSAWSELEADDEQLRPELFNLVARAYRMLEEHHGALEIAARGAQFHPGHRGIRDELYKARATLTDWEKAIVAPPVPVGPVTRDAPAGSVSDLGFLGGGTGPLIGTLPSGAERAPTVHLTLNGRAIATTSGSAISDGFWEFALNCRQALEFLGDGDVVSLECDGRPVTIEGYGSRLVVLTGYPTRSHELLRHVAKGHVFTKVGRLRKGYTAVRKREILTFFEDLSGLLQENTQHTCYPFYGNLLGAIREHDFVAHDVGGFDMGYVSPHTEPNAVRAEFIDLCRFLLSRGYYLRLTPWCAMIRPKARGRVFLDLNYGWFTPAGQLQLSFGWRYDPVTDAERFFAPREVPMAGHLVPVPGNAEEVLHQLYGPNWVVPEQGFDHTVDVQRNVDYLLTSDELDALQTEAPSQVRIDSVLGPDGEVVERR